MEILAEKTELGVIERRFDLSVGDDVVPGFTGLAKCFRRLRLGSTRADTQISVLCSGSYLRALDARCLIGSRNSPCGGHPPPWSVLLVSQIRWIVPSP